MVVVQGALSFKSLKSPVQVGCHRISRYAISGFFPTRDEGWRLRCSATDAVHIQKTVPRSVANAELRFRPSGAGLPARRCMPTVMVFMEVSPFRLGLKLVVATE